MTDPELFGAIIRQAPDAIIVADGDGRVRVWNKGAERLFGHPAADMVGRGLEAIIPAHLRAAHEQGFNRAVSSGTTKYDGRAMTTRSMHRDGTTIYVDISFALLTDDQGRVAGVLAVARDATSRHRAERDLRARVVALEARLAECLGQAQGPTAPAA
jgi:PAS domain S-box-containing protein